MLPLAGQVSRSARTGGARAVARRVLRRVRREAAFANLALSAELERADLSAADRALATELVYGVLRHQRRLDHAIGRHSRRPPGRIDPDVLDALRLAAYQILQLDRIPAHAAVNDAVEAARQLRGPQVAGFANAVLRRLTPDSWSAALPAEPLARLAIECSLPDALASYLVQRLGGIGGARILAERLLERAPLTARCNRARVGLDDLSRILQAEGAQVQPGRWSPLALRLAGLSSPFRARSYLDGLWTAQDEAAQLVVELLDVRPGQAVLDGCAGVGGKTTDIAARLAGTGAQVLAVDSSDRKLQLLQEHCRRMRLHAQCTTRQADLRQTAALGGQQFDRVLIDAPCTGLGLLRRHPEIKWRFDPDAVGPLAILQRELLTTAARALRPAGRLVYSVCTVTAEEGPAQAAWLQDRFAELEPDPPAEGPLAPLFGGRAELTLWPHEHDTDGFFMVRFRRRS